MPHANKGKRHHCPLDSGRAGNCRYTSSPDVPRHCGKHQVVCEEHDWIWTEECDEGCVVCLVASESSGTGSSASSEDGEVAGGAGDGAGRPRKKKRGKQPRGGRH